jgi:hypothetical protein
MTVNIQYVGFESKAIGRDTVFCGIRLTPELASRCYMPRNCAKWVSMVSNSMSYSQHVAQES